MVILTTPANATDGIQLQPMLKEQEAVYSIKPQELTGDKAYDWGENRESLDSNKTIANISLSKQVNRNGAGYFTVPGAYYAWTKDFIEAGKERLKRDTVRDATRQEIDELKLESNDLKQLVAELSLEGYRLKKTAIPPVEDSNGDGE